MADHHQAAESMHVSPSHHHAAVPHYDYGKIALQVVIVLWQILWPIRALLYYLAILLLFILKLLYRPVAFLLQPLLFLGRFVVACLIAPFQLLVKLEVSRHCSNHIT